MSAALENARAAFEQGADRVVRAMRVTLRRSRREAGREALRDIETLARQIRRIAFVPAGREYDLDAAIAAMTTRRANLIAHGPLDPWSPLRGRKGELKDAIIIARYVRRYRERNAA